LRKAKIDYSDKYPSGNGLKATDTKKVYVIQLTIEAYNTKEKLSNLKKCTIYAISSGKKIIRNGIDSNYFKILFLIPFKEMYLLYMCFAKMIMLKEMNSFI